MSTLALGSTQIAVVRRGSKSYAYRPDGRIIASAGVDIAIKLWDTQSGVELRALQGHSAAVQSLSFSPDGRLIAGGSADTSIRLWEAKTGRLLASLFSLDESDWLVVTPEGLFDGSPTHWSQILWRFSPPSFSNSKKS